MRSWNSLHARTVLVAGLGVASAVAIAPRAEACGGCFHPPSGPATQVTAHRMAFAVSPTRTILWDQIQYQGAPSSFGWVLPIRGKVDVGVSSDQLFQRLETGTQPNITPPPRPECHSKHICQSCAGSDMAGTPTASAGDSVDGGVSVWSTNVVGPYEATQLSATDSNALRTWLTTHGYSLPTEIAPIVDQYVSEGFGFLAIKLVPGNDVSRMVPIRIAFDGASPSLPLRMVAAGTGSVVGIKLFVFGEGRWEAKNFPNAEIATKDLSWDFRANGSNFSKLENDLVTSAPRSWITETSDDYGRAQFFDGLPPGTTSGDAGTVFASDTDQSEIEKAFPGRSHLTVTRLFAQLPASALADDLQVQASLGARIPATRQAPNSSNACQDVIYECCSPGVLDCSTAPSGEGASSHTFRWMGLGALGLVGLGVLRARRR
ncbi:MAG: hypothetical protein NVSMB47_20150 [Polyangiales bacterium]